MHYIIIILVVATVVIIQTRFLTNTLKKINQFLHIFYEDESSSALRIARADESLTDLTYQLEAQTQRISVKHANDTLTEIIHAINDYQVNNKVCDFHLIKDIVDRNCDAKEEEINTQIPVPLYFGLVGTMMGILVGILYLWLSGGITDLLSATDGTGAHGVEALLGGVALAMISSILGIIFTTWSANEFKKAKSTAERGKHTFLSWIQRELLPSLSDNVVGAIRGMAANLTEFNETFSGNTRNLGKTLDKINESYELQAQVVDAINKVRIGEIAAANLKLLDRLTEASGEIGQLAEYLHNTRAYLARVNELNEKLDAHERRTEFIEHASKFYAKHENWLTENIETANRSMKDSVEQYNQSAVSSLGKIQENLETHMRNWGEATQKTLAMQVIHFEKIIQTQQEKLNEKVSTFDNLVEELKSLSETKTYMQALVRATNEQRHELSKLNERLTAFSQPKINDRRPHAKATTDWVKIAAIIGGVVVVGYCFSELMVKIKPLLSAWFL